MSLGDQSHFVLPIVGTSSLSSSTLIKDSPEIQFTARILAATMVDSTAPQKAPKRPHRKRPPRAPKPSPAVEPPASDSPMPQVQVQGHRQDQQRRTTHPESSLASNRMVGGRHFGGLLSSSLAEPQPRNIDRALDAAAPEFLPSRPMPTNRGRGKSHRYGNPRSPIQPFQKSIHKRRTTKSPALDLATRIHEDIVNGLYECPICTNELERSSKIWSCGTCWTVFHLSCIKKWSQNDASVQAEQLLQEELPLIKAWRCPGCNLPQDVRPNYYTCWCEKEVNPPPIFGSSPHSCGQTCGKLRRQPQQCPHPCELQCHAGPCPPCTRSGPRQACFCGTKSMTRKCVDTKYESAWSCKSSCGRLLNCEKHFCDAVCHEGPCGLCDAISDVKCYCGKVERVGLCREKDEERSSSRTLRKKGVLFNDNWIGTFKCDRKCGKAFDCGKHTCEKECHPQEASSKHCPFSPDVLTRCPCGKTPLVELLDKPRTSCEDTIPNCNQLCSRQLSCGHNCTQTCHSGNCEPCSEIVPVTCRCGRVTTSQPCLKSLEDTPLCPRLCRSKLSCGRHECGDKCCPKDRKIKKSRPLDLNFPISASEETDHICTRICSRQLKCGSHSCLALCHKGPCGTCLEASFSELSCHCGRTVLQPPLRCGTKVPPCTYNCNRPKACAHPQVAHNCHPDEEACPNCPFLTEKRCRCGKHVLKNQQCWFKDARCVEQCGKKSKCGSHLCRQTCHRPGECEDANRPCNQLCGKSKKSCGHTCEEQCHAPYPCREDKPCTHKIMVTCSCQHLKQEMRCNGSKSSEGNSNKSLKCDDECARLERNRNLALALKIDPETHVDYFIPYSSETLAFFQEHPAWSQTQERLFRAFAIDSNEKRLRFKPMPHHQRAFLHCLSDDFGFDSESLDPDQHRHVAVFKTPRFVKAPSKLLADCVNLSTRSIVVAHPIAAPIAAPSPLPTRIPSGPFNSFVLTKPRFGLTLEDVHANLLPAISNCPQLIFETNFLPSEEIVIRARPYALAPKPPSTTTYETDRAIVEPHLTALKPSIEKLVLTNSLATALHLCRVDASLHILRREGAPTPDTSPSAGGWSQVAAKAAAPPCQRPVMEAFGVKSSFTVLSAGSASKAREKRKAALERKKGARAPAEEVEEDWEVAEERAEAVEKAEAGGVA